MENSSCYAQTFNVKVSKFVIELEYRNILQSIYNIFFLTVCQSARVDLLEARVSQLPEAEIPQAVAPRVGRVTDLSSVAILVQGS